MPHHQNWTWRVSATLDWIRTRKPTMSAFAIGAAALSLLAVSMTHTPAIGQPVNYMSAQEWKQFLGAGCQECHIPSWFDRWYEYDSRNAMIQARIAQLAALVESEGLERGARGPFRITMVGDSTMMQQHGVVCAFLAEHSGRRFDPSEHQEDCCIDTVSRHSRDESLTLATGREGGRGLCFRHAFQRFAELPDVDILGSPSAVYFGSGLHLLHMCRKGHPLEAPRVQGWLNYERDLEKAVHTYRELGGADLRLIFMTPHLIENTKYKGDFLKVLNGYRKNDTDITSWCDNQVESVAQNETGQDGYGVDAYCRDALLDRHGSEVVNRRSRSVMAKLGVPLVEGDQIVNGQAWATQEQDGRHYHVLVPVEVWSLLGVLVDPYNRVRNAEG